VPSQPSAPLSQSDFLARIEGTKFRISQLTTNISSIASTHQRMLASPDSNVSAQLENIVTQTQIQNTGIKDEIKFLEKDAARSPDSTFKGTQIANLKRTFKKQLEDYQKEEQDYERRYRDGRHSGIEGRPRSSASGFPRDLQCWRLAIVVVPRCRFGPT